MFTITVVLKDVRMTGLVELLEEAGSFCCGNSLTVYGNLEKGHVVVDFYKHVPHLHEAYFDVIHELTDADLIDNVTTIERD